MTIDSGARQSNKINVIALRAVPYAVLVKALVSISVIAFTLLSMKAAAQGNAAEGGADAIVLSISYESIHLMTIISYVILIESLKELKSISDKLGIARQIAMATVAFYVVGLLLSVLEVEFYSNNYDAISSVLFWLNYVVTTAKAIGLIAAVLYVIKGFAERLEVIGYTDEAIRIMRPGRIYLAANIVLLIITSIAEVRDSINLGYTVGASSAICVFLEIWIFISLRKSTLIIWHESRKDLN